jgi:hypothetical protein
MPPSAEVIHQSVLAYGKARWLWISLAVVGLCVLAYVLDDTGLPPAGGSALGYTLGTIGALLILWLLSFGIRKRSYVSTAGTVQGWLSAHIYLGVSLLVIVTLHTGFQLGWNIHGLAYGLMCLVVASGTFGVFVYLRYPQLLSGNRAAQSSADMLTELAELDARALRAAAELPPVVAEVTRSNRDRTLIGGGALALLAGRDGSTILLPDTRGSGAVRYVRKANADQAAMLDWLTAELAASRDGEQSRRLQVLLGLLGARRVLLRRLRRDAQLKAWLRIWLYLHVPLSFGLLAALLAHVVTVFLYW